MSVQGEIYAEKLTPDEARSRLLNRLYEIRLQSILIAHELSSLGDLQAGLFMHEAHNGVLQAVSTMKAKHPHLT